MHRDEVVAALQRQKLYAKEDRKCSLLTSAAGMPSGGRHWSSTSCSSDTSFPRGSWSNVFLKSAENTQRSKSAGVRQQKPSAPHIDAF